MNVSESVVSLPVAPCSPSAHDALARLIANREELEGFFESVLGQLERLWNQLEERHQTLAAQRMKFEEQIRERLPELDRRGLGIDEPTDRTFVPFRDEADDGQKEPPRDEVRREIVEATASLAEAMVHQRRQMDEERARWHEEMTRMRQLLEVLVRDRMTT